MLINGNGVAGDDPRGDFDTLSFPSFPLFSCLPLSVCIGLSRAGDKNARGVEPELPDLGIEALRDDSRRRPLGPMLTLLPELALDLVFLTCCCALINHDDSGPS